MAEALALGPSAAAAQAHPQGTVLEVEQLALEPIGDVSVAVTT